MSTYQYGFSLDISKICRLASSHQYLYSGLVIEPVLKKKEKEICQSISLKSIWSIGDTASQSTFRFHVKISTKHEVISCGQ